MQHLPLESDTMGLMLIASNRPNPSLPIRLRKMAPEHVYLASAKIIIQKRTKRFGAVHVYFRNSTKGCSVRSTTTTTHIADAVSVLRYIASTPAYNNCIAASII